MIVVSGKLIVISKSYLYAVAEEAMKYSFDIYGYSSCRDAIIQLPTFNMKDLLGVLFVDDVLERDDVEDINEFLNSLYVSLSDCKMTVGFLFDNIDNLKYVVQMKREYGLKNLKLKVSPDFGILTDKHITDAFASILKETRNAYNLKGLVSNVRPSTTGREIKYRLPFTKGVLSIVEPVRRLGDLKDTVVYDPVMNMWINKDDTLAVFRKAYIYSEFGLSFDWEENIGGDALKSNGKSMSTFECLRMLIDRRARDRRGVLEDEDEFFKEI